MCLDMGKCQLRQHTVPQGGASSAPPLKDRLLTSPHHSCLILELFGTLGYLADDQDAQLSMLKCIPENNTKTYQASTRLMNPGCSEQGREQGRRVVVGEMWGL